MKIDIIDIIKNNKDNRNIIFNEFFNFKKFMIKEDIKPLLNFILNDEINYDIKQFLITNTLAFIFKNRIYNTDYTEYFNKIKVKYIYEGNNLICSCTDEIIEYLTNIGYDMSDINDKKYLLNINFNKIFKVSYYNTTKKIPSFYIKTLNDLKSILHMGNENIIKFDYLCNNLPYDIYNKYDLLNKESIIVDNNELLSTMILSDRKKLRNLRIEINNDLSFDPTTDNNISTDIKIYFLYKKITFVSYLDIIEKHYNMDETLFEIENTDDNKIYLERMGYNTKYAIFNRLFVDLHNFEYYNENILDFYYTKKDDYDIYENIKKINNIELYKLIN